MNQNIETNEPSTETIKVAIESIEHKAKLDKIEKAYSSEPWWYDLRGLLILTFSYRSTIPAQIRLFGNNMGAKHLEAAIGTGTLLGIILKWRKLKRAQKSEIVAFDYAPRMLAGAIKRFRKVPHMNLELGDVTRLKYESNSFDTINVANALHCFPDIKVALSELHRVLKLNGTLAGNILLYPKGRTILDRISNRINNWGIKKGILYTPYQKQEIETALKDLGYKFESSRVVGNCYDFIVRKV
jgi:ubiquinone/menaquinone biosynthesis C-methylase UbiE